MLEYTDDFDKEAWKNNPDPDFLDICRKSRAYSSWLSYQKVLDNGYKDSPIKPINWYAANIIAPPKLVSISGNTVTLRQYTHADMFLLQTEEFYNVDRPWIRQYYMTNQKFEIPEDLCFPYAYKFYTPWFIDFSTEISYTTPDEDTAFYLHEMKDFWFAPGEDSKFVKPHFIPFSFKKIGKHMEDKDFGIIRFPEPMYDMTFVVDDIMIERIKEYYGK